MNGTFHKRGSVLRLYLKRKDGGRGLIGVEDCVRTEEAGLAEYVRQSSEWMLNAVNDMGIVSSVETADEYRKRVDAERKENLAGKALHGKFFREVSEVAAEGGIDIDRSSQWLKGGFLTKTTEGYIMAAQEQALGTRWKRLTIDGEEGIDGKCRVCGQWWETVKHVVSGCGELAKKQYTIRHDQMGVRVHWELCRKYGIEGAVKWYDHVPSSICSTNDGTVEIYWDRTVYTAKHLKHNRPDVQLLI